MTMTLAQPVEAPTVPSTAKRQEVGYWSPGGQIFLTDGKAFGVNKSGATVCLGNARDIEQKLTGQMPLMAETVLDNIIRLDVMARGGDIAIGAGVSRKALQPFDGTKGNSRVPHKTVEPKPAKVKSSAKRKDALQAKNRRGKQ